MILRQVLELFDLLDTPREMAEEFEKDNPNIKVELVVTDWDTYKDKITTAISAKGAPELFTILLTDVKPFADKGLLEPLTELGTKAGVDFDDILAPALDITSVDGQAYGVPFRYDGSAAIHSWRQTTPLNISRMKSGCQDIWKGVPGRTGKQTAAVISARYARKK